MHGLEAEWADFVDANGRRVIAGRNGMKPAELRRLGLDRPEGIQTPIQGVGPDK